MNKGIKITKKIISYIIIVVIAILTTSLIYLNILNNNILNENNILTMIDNSNYYREIKDETLKLLEGYVQQSGFDKTILKDIVTEEIVKKDIHNIIDEIYTNSTAEVSDISKNLQNNIDKYIKDNNKLLDVAQKNSIKELISLMSNEYKNNIFPTSSILHLNKIVQGVSDKYVTINNYIILAIFILIVILLFLSFKKSILYVSIAFLIVGILVFGIFMYIDITLNLDNIYVYSLSITNILKLIISNITNDIYMYSTFIFFVSTIICYMSCFMIFKSNNNRK